MFGYLSLYFKDLDGALSVAQGYLADPDKYTRLHAVPLNGKVRKLRAYADNKEGKKLRELHENVARFVWGAFQSSNASFAYKKGRGIVDCVRAHINGKVFLKSDIHAFFDNTRLDKFLMLFFKNPKFMADKPKLSLIFSACFYDGALPLGFASSPAISDFFLHELDRRMSMLMGVVYTRYADDFLISATNVNATFVLEGALKTLKSELTKLGLEINEKKTFIRALKVTGDSIRFLGLNLVRTGYPFNRVTVSGSFLKETGLDLAAAIQKNDQKAYEAARGKIAFIRMCSDGSFEKFKRLVRVKMNLDLDEMLESSKVGDARYAMQANRL